MSNNYENTNISEISMDATNSQLPFYRIYLLAINLAFVTFIVMGSSSVSLASDLKEELRTRHERSISSKDGKSYEFQAAKEFWRDASFLEECTQNTKPAPDPFEIVYEVNTNGELGGIYFFPETDVAKCIKKYVINRSFSPPKEQFVGWINMSFK